MIATEFLSRLEKVKKTSDGWAACCPGHKDSSPSLSIKDGGDRILLNCHANCTAETIVGAIGLQMSDLFTDPKTKKSDGHEVEVARYDYTDERGDLLYQVVRFHPKTFRQRHKGSDGEWVWNMTDVRRVPYQLPKVIASETVLICEGEKDADALTALKLCGTCNVGGAGKWLDAYSEFLRGKTVVVCPDQDEPGKKHGEQVIKSLTGIAKFIVLWNVDTGKDVSDWLKAKGDNAKKALHDTLAGLKPLNLAADLPIKSMEELEAEYIAFVRQHSDHAVSFGKWLPEFNWMRPLVPGELAVIMADTGVGKTAILQNIAHKLRPLPILMFEMELPPTLMFERFVQIGVGVTGDAVENAAKNGDRYSWEHGKIDHIFTCTTSRMNPKEMERIINAAELRMGERPAIVMVDYIGLLNCPGNSRYERMSFAAEQMKMLAKATNTVFIVATQVARRQQEDGKESAINLHDAKDSGSIENSAGLVLGAWRAGNGGDTLKVKVLKSTKGGAGKIIECNFDGPTLRITERAKWAKVDADEVMKGYPA